MSKKQAAITVAGVSKNFKIPHEKAQTLRACFVNCFNRHRGYETFRALQDVTFEVKKGEFFGIVGRNGSGKSTLLKILAGIYVPDRGSVAVSGQISPFLELGVGFNPELTGRDNIYLNAAILGLNREQIDKRFKDIVAFSELKRFIDQKLKNYSSGMQVRLAFSVAIHADKDILLMDEVLAVGDNNFQQKCLEEFSRYRQEGKTVILVTHDTAVVQRYCDRALLLREGRIMKIGEADDVVAEYIYENMSDEEKRIFDEERQEKEELKKVGQGGKALCAATITGVEFFGKTGNAVKEFQTGEDIVVRISYKAAKKIERPVFGLSLDFADGTHITGPNTRKSGFKIASIEGEGFVELVIRENQLNKGVYVVTVGLFNWDNTRTYDFQIKRYSFQIITNDAEQDGAFRVGVSWNMVHTGTAKNSN